MTPSRNPDYDDPFFDDEEDDDAQKDKYMTFRLASEDYAIPLQHVTEIVAIQRITAIPDMPPFLRGVINLRGQVLPVMDVRARFNMEPRPYDDRTCVVLVSLRESVTVGLIVDTVSEVVSLPPDQISQPPRMLSGPGSRYICGMGRLGDSVKIILDVQRMLFDDELAILQLHSDTDPNRNNRIENRARPGEQYPGTTERTR